MDHEAGAALARGPPRQPGHLHAHDLERGRYHARLDPADEALVLVQDGKRVVEVDARLRDDVRIGGEPGLADVQERDDLRVAAGQDVPGECAEGGRPRTAGIDDGRDAGKTLRRGQDRGRSGRRLEDDARAGRSGRG
jgi:hypothetical protein